MSDSKKSGFLSGPKQAWQDPKARKGIVFSLVVVGVVGTVSYAMMGNNDGKANAVPAQVSLNRPSDVQQGDAMSPASERYKEMIREQDAQRLADASKTPGAMVLPKIAGLSDPNAKPEPAAQMTADSVRADQQGQVQQGYANNGQKVQTPQEHARTSPSYQAVMKLMTDQVAKGMAEEQGWAPIRPPVAVQQAPGSPASGVNAGAQTQTAVQGGMPAQSAQLGQVSSRPLIQMGTSVFATLDTAVNTDYSGPVVATIHEGPYSGAKVSGTKTLEFDAVVIKFTLLSPGQGMQSLPINAYAITIDESKKFGLTGIQGHTDRHLMQRWIAPAAAAFITGYGQAASQQRQTIISNEGGLAQSTEPLSTRDRMISSVGIAVQPIVQDLQRMASRPITVSLPSNREIGILFATDVMPLARTANGGNPQTLQMDSGLSQQQLFTQNQQLILQQQAAARQQGQQQDNYGQAARMGYPYQTNGVVPMNSMYAK